MTKSKKTTRKTTGGKLPWGSSEPYPRKSARSKAATAKLRRKASR